MVSWSPVGAFLLSWVSGAWLGGGREVYFGAEGIREARGYTKERGAGGKKRGALYGGCDR